MNEHSSFTKFRDKDLKDPKTKEAYDKAGERLKLCDDQFEQLEMDWLGLDMYGDGEWQLYLEVK